MKINCFLPKLIHIVLIIWIEKNYLINKSKEKFQNNYLVKKNLDFIMIKYYYILIAIVVVNIINNKEIIIDHNHIFYPNQILFLIKLIKLKKVISQIEKILDQVISHLKK